jgi:hypothetical protein
MSKQRLSRLRSSLQFHLFASTCEALPNHDALSGREHRLPGRVGERSRVGAGHVTAWASGGRAS